MAGRRYRPLLAGAAVAMALLGGAAILISGSQGAAAGSGVYVIQIHADGFNPQVCMVNRGDTVQWQNLDSVEHHPYSAGVGLNGPPGLDAGVVEPGAFSGKMIMESGTIIHYVDELHPELKGVLETPGTQNSGQVSCSQLPPTPTPSPTPSVTATPQATATATASPTPSPTATPAVPPRCVGEFGCAVAPALAYDGPAHFAP